VSAELTAAKRRLRRQLGARRRAVEAEVVARAGRAVADWLDRCSAFTGAERVCLYAALPGEIPTRPCFERLAQTRRTALLPRLDARGRLVFYPLARWEDLRPGRYAVPEPPEEGDPQVPGPADLVLVPGVAFDAAGNRLGRGGGHYDAAFPPRADGPLLFGVAHAFQVIESLPHGSRDRRMDAIVTERGIQRVARRE
jgi:5-formyltetrahydrofolate cyclo-ligase